MKIYNLEINKRKFNLKTSDGDSCVRGTGDRQMAILNSSLWIQGKKKAATLRVHSEDAPIEEIHFGASTAG